ncbi:hypothetical protein Ae201684_007349 [Aphanomyces euteiches]|uniref:WRKY19-like zinc finger domain-containing protein n=1 Tax=Aphanomyces euteiches TaxID=100861 RepID=A0A6G0X8J7_9STRA|nr:hypothetical protein Ae201684_007349 [Aphanomyces euteiches]
MNALDASSVAEFSKVTSSNCAIFCRQIHPGKHGGCRQLRHSWICFGIAMSSSLHDTTAALAIDSDICSIIHDLQEWMYIVNQPKERKASTEDFDSSSLSIDELGSILLDATPASSDSESLISECDVDPATNSTMVCRVESCLREARFYGLCTSHGGINKCQVLGCSRRAKRGSLCPLHGGTKCCRVQWCANAAQTQGLCKAHGGGPRCTMPGCDKSSQGRGLCRAHGGGKRCDHEGCTRGVQRGNKCATHGGVRVCTVDGCSRMDRGGGLCEVHRRDHKCIVSGCTRLRHVQSLCKLHLRLMAAA